MELKATRLKIQVLKLKDVSPSTADAWLACVEVTSHLQKIVSIDALPGTRTFLQHASSEVNLQPPYLGVNQHNIS